ncbi:hypothetical protein LAD12857_03920 [Lacrimispora amygdalina]|uniref:histidine kinase n=1 Tax=Lacrimispora amygdalina TaxID=253257 RepID=A0ABQ5M0L5_9FIRM
MGFVEFPRPLDMQKGVNPLTVKRRLFISNIMMLVIPTVISLTVIGAMLSTVMNILGVQDGDSEQFYRVTDQVRNYAEEWSQNSDIEQIKSGMDAIEQDYGTENMFLTLYQNGERQYTAGNPVYSPFIEATLTESGEHYFTMDQTGIYKTDAGEYTILIVDTNFQTMDDWYYIDNLPLINFYILVIVIVIAIIFMTNRLLTRMVVKSIIIPLDTLVYGVHQIRDGNLNYRIEYAGKDEFADVCADFNEMAERLLVMVNARQRDEDSRKELIAGISHDLCTPLTSIKTYVEGIELGMASTPEKLSHYLDTIKSKAIDMDNIINQLFLFSKLDIGEFPMQTEEVDIGKWLDGYIDAVLEEYGHRGLQINLVENITSVAVDVDSVQFRNVLTNIMENSVKYGNKEQGIMRIACRSDNSNVVITLSDNGSGVPEEMLEKLFEIFFRGDKARTNTSRGSGLGLAISAKIMELLNGTIKAVNSPEGGLSVMLTLPIAGGE